MKKSFEDYCAEKSMHFVHVLQSKLGYYNVRENTWEDDINKGSPWLYKPCAEVKAKMLEEELGFHVYVMGVLKKN